MAVWACGTRNMRAGGRGLGSPQTHQHRQPLSSVAPLPLPTGPVPRAGAAFYGNEALVGAGLAEFVGAGRRGELFITSKVWNTHHKPADAR
jgi:hypothetical protein